MAVKTPITNCEYIVWSLKFLPFKFCILLFRTFSFMVLQHISFFVFQDYKNISQLILLCSLLHSCWVLLYLYFSTAYRIFQLSTLFLVFFILYNIRCFTINFHKLNLKMLRQKWARFRVCFLYKFPVAPE